MSVQSEINRILTNIRDSYAELISMGATTPLSQDTDHLVDTVRSLGGHFLNNYVSYSESQNLTGSQRQVAKSNIGIDSGTTLPQSPKENDIFLLDIDDSTALSNIGAVSYKYNQSLNNIDKQTALSNIGASPQHSITQISGCSINITTGNATATIQSVEYNGYCVEVGIQLTTTTTINVGGNIQGTIIMPEEYRPRRLSHDISWGGSSCILARLRPNPDLYCQIVSSQLASGVVFNLTFTYLI